MAEQNTAGTSNLHLTNRSKKNDPEKPQVAPRNREPNSNNPGKLKNVTMYQPPPIAHSSTNQ